jgi:hypothetical protein
MNTTASNRIIDVGGGCESDYDEWIRTDPDLKIHVIEPHPELAEGMRQRLSHLIDKDKISIHEFACIAEPSPQSRCDFFFCNYKSCSSTLPFADIDAPKKWKYPIGWRERMDMEAVYFVTAYTLDEFFQNIGSQSFTIKLLAINVQGDAFRVLSGLKDDRTWERIKSVAVKVHKTDWELYRNQSTPAQVTEILATRGQFQPILRKELSRNQEEMILFKLPKDIRKKRRPVVKSLNVVSGHQSKSPSKRVLSSGIAKPNKKQIHL